MDSQYEANFQFYPVTMDEKPHSVRVDLNALDLEAEFPHLYVLRKPYAARDNGFPLETSFSVINEFEDAVASYLSHFDIYQIGVITGNGVCDYFFVSKTPFDFEKQLREQFPDELFGVIVRENDGFEIYKNVLYPDEFEVSVIYNQNVCMNLEHEGERFEKERDVDFYMVFETETQAEQFTQHFTEFAHTIRVEPREDEMVQVHMIANLIPTLPVMNGISQSIVTLTNQYGGHFDGWGCRVEA